MSDNLQDIDPAIVESVLTHADAFIAADTQINTIIDWGKNELQLLENRAISSLDFTVQNFKDESAKIRSEVSSKLQALEHTLSNALPPVPENDKSESE